MGLLHLFASALALGGVGLTNPVPQGGSVSPAKFCDAATTICYAEWTSPERIAFRFAIPDTATPGNFSVLLQISAPRSVGWAGLAWGGVMVNNPLTLGWANGNTAVVSSRSASSRSYPGPYAGATYTVLPGTTANNTHWTLSVLAKGVSSWGSTRLDPSSTVRLAYAQAPQPPFQPANNASRFNIHTSRNTFMLDLKSAQVADFAELVAKALTPA
ncbi:hypothetical protein VTJ83DRAFT_6214 [Remersonia thermophila]|uniref:Cellobiose dehydrogenase-like cytochrome domain-containing protein n=1 Tax=Remersonia thermophila TaxID=72144 RepID=A0ABR4D521_9PEZI